MKLVREHIFEKFIDDSDPIEDMDIGLKPIIEKWIKENVYLSPGSRSRSEPPAFIINDDSTIDIHADCRINFLDGNLPNYIQFNNVYGDFAIEGPGISSKKNQNITSLRGCPKFIEGDFQCSRTSIKNLIGGPEKVTGRYICSCIQTLKSLNGFPKHIGEYVACNNKAGLTMDDIPKGTYIGNYKLSNIDKWSDW